MKATLNGTVLAQADEADLLRIEGNWYFPLDSVSDGVLTDSPTQYHCSWKGDAKYYHANVDGSEHQDMAWGYPNPLPGANERVGEDISGYIAFDPAVEITEE